MRAIADRMLPADSTARMFAKMLRQGPFALLRGFLSSVSATFKLTGRIFPVQCIVFPGVMLKVSRHRDASVMLKGRLIFRPHSNMRGFSSVTLERNANLTVDGDFQLGHGVSFLVAEGGQATIAGRSLSTGSGITADTVVMVENSLRIGRDVIIAWGCTISDSDWHCIEGSERCLPVTIGDDVWLGHAVSVLKGAHIPDGCIVGPRSVVGRSEYPERALIAGAPAKVLREGVSWKR